MPDPVSIAAAGNAIAKVATPDTALPPEAVKLLDQVSGGATRELSATLGDRIRARRLRNQIKLLDKTRKFLQDVGHEPTEVKWNVLFPLLDAGSLEDDDDMAIRWAALLANAADPAADDVPPSFPEILKQLAPAEARILDLYGRVLKERFPANTELDLSLHDTSVAHEMEEDHGIDHARFRLSMANLYRHQLLERDVELKSMFGGEIRMETRKTRVTALGRAFLRACQPPTA